MTEEQIQQLVSVVQDINSFDFVRSEAFTQLLEEFKFLLYAAIRYVCRFNNISACPSTLRDVQSVFYERVLEYDAAKTSSFRKYISQSLYTFLNNLYTGVFLKKQRFTYEYQEDNPSSQNSGGCFHRGRSSQTNSTEISSDFYQFLLENYDPLVVFVFCHYFQDGYTQQEIGELLGKSQSWVSTVIRRVSIAVRARFTEAAFREMFCSAQLKE